MDGRGSRAIEPGCSIDAGINDTFARATNELMHNLSVLSQLQARRHFFKECGVGVGKIALASLLCSGRETRAAQGGQESPSLERHHKAKTKSVIHLFMSGGPSQLDLFDYKPALTKHDGK